MRRFLSLILVTALVGCGEITGVAADVQGTYYLYSVNGFAPPYRLSSDAFGETVIVDGTLRMNSSGRFVETLLVEEYSAGRTSRYTDEYTGRYSGRNGYLVLRYDEGGELEAEYDSREVVIYGRGQTIVYRR